MDADLDALEYKVHALIAHAETLREANAALQRDLAAVQEHNRVLAQRMRAAAVRVDALIARLPAESVPLA